MRIPWRPNPSIPMFHDENHYFSNSWCEIPLFHRETHAKPLYFQWNLRFFMGTSLRFAALQASFLSLVDRCTMAQLGQRLFAAELEVPNRGIDGKFSIMNRGISGCGSHDWLVVWNHKVGNHRPNWLIFFSEGLKPPTRWRKNNHSIFWMVQSMARILKLELHTISKAYVSGLCSGILEYPNKIWPEIWYYVLTYLYFRILRFPMECDRNLTII